MKLNILVSKTTNGKLDYLQILSDDQFTINIVLLAEQVKIEDRRT